VTAVAPVTTRRRHQESQQTTLPQETEAAQTAPMTTKRQRSETPQSVLRRLAPKPSIPPQQRVAPIQASSDTKRTRASVAASQSAVTEVEQVSDPSQEFGLSSSAKRKPRIRQSRAKMASVASDAAMKSAPQMTETAETDSAAVVDDTVTVSPRRRRIVSSIITKADKRRRLSQTPSIPSPKQQKLIERVRFFSF
jgi:hypothetical protein